MAREFLASHGVDIDQVLSMSADDSTTSSYKTRPLSKITGARLPSKAIDTFWDVTLGKGRISAIEKHDPESAHRLSNLDNVLQADGRLLAPSLCHAHVHLDKCFILDDPKYSDLDIVEGNFAEAMSLTGTAKRRFEEEDLLRRGRLLTKQSLDVGVTAMRAFVEVDTVVEFKCVDAALKLKEEFRDVCEIQICAFAQLPIFSGEDGLQNRRLLEKALQKPGVDVLGTTPYVEESLDLQYKNIAWAIGKAISTGKQLDFHLDYNLDGAKEPSVWYLLEELRAQHWKDQRVCLGHCTRLTLFSEQEWQKLQKAIGNTKISFVGLPQSDLFMMGRPEGNNSNRLRGTLQVVEMVSQHGLKAAISMNNIGNAFTPQGSCDPLSLASLGVGIYQAGTSKDANVLFEAVSSRAKEAIGCEAVPLELSEGDKADLVLLKSSSISAACRYAPAGRVTIVNARVVESDSNI